MFYNLIIKDILEATSWKLNRFKEILFRKYYYATSAAISLGCTVCAEYIEQKAAENRKKLDIRRLSSMAAYGILSGFTGASWYRFSAKLLQNKSVLTQVLLYQVIYSPGEYMLFYTSVGLLEGQSFRDCLQEIKNKFVFSYLCDWVILMPFMYLNFKVVPFKYRVLYDNTVQCIWCIFLSYLKHHKLDEVISIDKFWKFAMKDQFVCGADDGHRNSS